MSQGKAKLRLLSLARNLRIEDAVRNFIIQCNDHEKHEIVAKFGEVKGFYSKININLPVACDCILEHGSSDYKFEEKISRKQQSYLIERLIKANRESWILDEKVEIDQIFEYRYPDESVCVINGNKREEFHELNLGEIVVYRPKSSIHYSISGISRSQVKEVHGQKVPEIKYKKNITGWSFQRKSGKMYPFWNLKIINVIKCHEKKRNRDGHNVVGDSELSKSSIMGNRSTELDSEESNDESEDEFWTIVLIGDKNLISKHVDLFKRGLNNGLDRITNELISNSCLIAKYLDESSSNNLLRAPSYYYPNYFGDITTSVKAHYNKKKIQNAELSIISGLRKYNNEIKRALIDYYFDLQLRVRSGSPLSVLDLACGHGQDILKYRGKKLRCLIGIDISAEEISEARHRIANFGNSINFPVEYHVGNLLSRASFSKILKNSMFEIISIQLSMHYMLINEEISREFLANISRHLKPGGFFLGSTISCDKVFFSIKNGSRKINYDENTDNFDEQGNSGPKNVVKYVSGNSIYKIYVEENVWRRYFSNEVETEEGLRNFRTDWENKYDFWLIEHINQYEYVVPWDSFCKLASEVGLELVKYSDFPEFMHYISENFPNLRLSSWINNSRYSSSMTPEENEVFNLYCIFVFRKIEESNKPNNMIHKLINKVDIDLDSLKTGIKISRKN
ncbi:Abd1p RNA guanine-methyltransferase (cap methyltransferase) [Cryptosporidium xiaoi]|uniref:mRNA (guanine-N(7))-methyltransferase n=1 Tax=Cryptosporidium xiaoi TaxID=659607 RepID=A0AAV9Y101_9CRYT